LARLLVAATARREELDEGHPLHDLTTALQAHERFSEIELSRLSREDTALLAERTTGVPLDPAEPKRRYGDSEGSPLFVVEALKLGAPADAPRSAMPPTPRSARPTGARPISRSRGRSATAIAPPRLLLRCITKKPA
jgi:hypothetical protein